MIGFQKRMAQFRQSTDESTGYSIYDKREVSSGYSIYGTSYQFVYLIILLTY